MFCIDDKNRPHFKIFIFSFFVNQINLFAQIINRLQRQNILIIRGIRTFIADGNFFYGSFFDFLLKIFVKFIIRIKIFILLLFPNGRCTILIKIHLCEHNSHFSVNVGGRVSNFPGRRIRIIIVKIQEISRNNFFKNSIAIARSIIFDFIAQIRCKRHKHILQFFNQRIICLDMRFFIFRNFMRSHLIFEQLCQTILGFCVFYKKIKNELFIKMFQIYGKIGFGNMYREPLIFIRIIITHQI